ncbi:cysteine-rich receptor-like protein kinase 8 [Silene latifolia]|uniref:cysteine-rich receptor-like protein kinase 8 n=1 Tax=Silene latifolia TaxID=37657 RepID=UPI003D786DFA
MYQISWLLAFLPVLIVTMIHQTTTASAQFVHTCTNDTMFTNGSTYQTNLNSLLRALASNATNNPSGFYRTTVGNPTIEAIYGEYLCTGDQNISSCHQCVATATTTDIPRLCPNMKVAILWYDECLVRYSNTSFFNSMDQSPSWIAWNPNNIIGDETRYMDAVTNMISNVIAVRAAKGGSFKKFATDFVNYSAIQPIYGLGQCTPNLNANDCYECLNSSIQSFHQKPGGRVLAPSCIVRFEAYPFFNLSYLPQASPPSPSPLLSPSHGKKKISTKVLVAIIVAALLVFSVALCLICICVCLLRNKARKVDVSTHAETHFTAESLQYDFATLLNATNNFSDENKLGEGGFGGVYKGTLSNGKLIAVKRLSASSSQGIQEFKTEVLVVAKLQHRNLVRLLGFCYTKQEKLLVYEYFPNKSLDNFIFDHENRQLLNWERRYNIIRGIARGLLYLHHDSQLRIIHRDLKASNILLDDQMNPKISDFGTSRIFGVDHSQTNYTNIVVGTYGYMAPEYALQGQFSIKSDAYSFGVLVLEIISGRKASTFNQAGDAEDLLSYAWRQWEAGTPLEFVDTIIRDSCSNNTDVMRCIQIGLLCVQESVEDRPTMANVVLTLDSYSITLPVPEQSDFLARPRVITSFPKEVNNSDHSSSKSIPLSVNEDSITELEPR